MYNGKTFIFQCLILLGLLVISFQLGAAVYEMRVVIPIWIEHLPNSAKGWNANIEPGNFWALNGMALTLLSFLNLIGVFIWKGKKRKWLLAGVVLQILIILATILFFVPILNETIFSNSKALSDDAIIRKSMLWYNWNWIRMATVFVSWYCFVRAFEQKPL